MNFVRCNSDDNFTCIVRDETTVDFRCSKYTTSCSPSTSVRSFYEEVASLGCYKVGTFLLVWRSSNGIDLELDDQSSEPLVDVGLIGRRHNFVLKQKDECDPEKLPGSSSGHTSSANQHEEVEDETFNWNISPLAAESSPSPAAEPPFIGLVNQAMTCYLNSLLQSLYMTPEFRNALYKWRFDGPAGEEARSIPFQLQKLFVRLQTSTKKAVETTDVTTSFGWTSSDAWQQQDVQELCRVMFDALEKKFQGTDQNDLIKHLYEGKIQDYVKCLECGHVSARTDTYLDVPLVIKPFGTEKACGSVEEALESFVTPETLEGSNQYMCARCGKKVDAHKGLKFVTFPYLLTLQLKRFDFDYATMDRIKLNNRVTFPKRLDLSSFIAEKSKEQEVTSGETKQDVATGSATAAAAAAAAAAAEAATPTVATSIEAAVSFEIDASDISSGNGPTSVVTVSRCDPADISNGTDPAVISSGSDAADCTPAKAIPASTPSNGMDDAEPVSVPTPSEDAEASVTSDAAPASAHEYELFSIMVHSGSAVGGHYYAYIRSFEDGNWYSFNDQSVINISDVEIESTFGSCRSSLSGFSSMYTSSANAYMLMYRQVDKSRNVLPLATDSLPAHVNEIIIEDIKREEEEQERAAKARLIWSNKVYRYNTVTEVMDFRLLSVDRNVLLRDAVAAACKLWDVVMPLERCRLVKFDNFYSVPIRTFGGMEDRTVSEVVSKSSGYCDLMLDTCSGDEEFESYGPGDNSFLRISYVDVVAEAVVKRTPLRADLLWTLAELKQRLGRKFKCGTDNMRIMMDRYYSPPHLIEGEESTLKFHGFFSASRLYVAPCISAEDLEDAKTPFAQSRLQRVVDTYLHALTLRVLLPPEESIAPYRVQTESSQPPRLPVTSNSSSSSTEADTEADTVMIVLDLDKRSTVAELKQKIAGIINVRMDDFKLYRKHLNGQEFEVTTLTETLLVYDERSRMRVSMGRALHPGEYRVKVYLFELNPEPPAPEPSSAASASNGAACTVAKPAAGSVAELSYLCDTIVAKGMTVLQMKGNILQESDALLPSSVARDPTRFRVRRRTWRCPAAVLRDAMVFDEDVYVYSDFTVFLQPLPGKERVTSAQHTVVFLRRWTPSPCSLGLWEEVVLAGKDVATLKREVSACSGVPVEHVAFCRPYGSYPSDTSLLDLPDQEWNPPISDLADAPINLSEDGAVFFYHDQREKIPKLSDEQRRALQKQDTARRGRFGHGSTFSTKEKALKIYTSADDDDSH